MLGLVILFASTALVYALAWGMVWLLTRIVSLPDWARPGLPWFLVQAYLVSGLYLTGDLPGAPRALLYLLGLAAALTIAFGLLALLRRQRNLPVTLHLASWMVGGTLPWGMALLIDILA